MFQNGCLKSSLTKWSHKKHIVLPYSSNHPTISHSPPASHHMWLEKLRVGLKSPVASVQIQIKFVWKKQIPRNIIFNHFTLSALWYIQTAFCGNETSNVYWVKSQKHQNKEMYLHCNICLGTHSTPTCWNPEPPATFKNPVTHGVCDQSTDQLVQQTNMNSITITMHGYILLMAPAFIPVTMVITGLFCDLPTKKTIMSSW